VADKPTPITPAAQEAPKTHAVGGFFKDAKDAERALREKYDAWSGKLADLSFQLSIGVIGANWAVCGQKSELIKNRWAVASIAVVVLGILVSVVSTWTVAEMLLRRIRYAQDDPDRWSMEREKFRKDEHWPFTPAIDAIGSVLRVCRAAAPVIGGILFFVAIFEE
jgi:hypothetical protein